MLLEDGSFFGFEGLGDSYGCCPLNCTHVWNYEQTVAYLFPQLERSMRETDFLHNTLPNGYMTFRTLVPLGNYWWKFKACADGQMGAIIRAYREWKLSGDTEWLRRIWPKVKLALEFAWLGPGTHPPKGLEWTNEQITMPWDPDKNGVMEGEQHNTYDIEFYGPNTMTGSLYLGALKASTEMAGAMGEPAKAKEYETLFENGSRLYDEKLWNGNYYVQDVSVLKGLSIPKHLISPTTEQCDAASECRKTAGGEKSAFTCGDTIPKYQYRTGCLSDQLLGQYLAHVAGLGYVLDREHVRTAMRSIFEHNFKRSMAEFHNVQRVYALNDEAGLLLCSWPKGDRPSLPFVYSDEVWTGIEYQVAATLIYNGWLKEGLAVVKAVRDRYNGTQRNPWDEEECGHHYARAMASWALLLALSGYHYDGVAHLISFAPAVSREDFRTFWSCGTGWGTFAQKETNISFDASLALQYGSLNLGTLSLAWRAPKGKEPVVTINGVRQAATLAQREGTIQIVLRDPTVLKKGDVVRVSY
jgi:hypothetical protein